MKIKAFTIILILFWILNFSKVSKGDETFDNLNPINVELLWVDIYQNEDKETLEIEEFYFLNITGLSAYDDNFYIWLNDKSKVEANCCGGAPNMACRFTGGGAMACFNIGKKNNNLHFGNPTVDQEFRSYYNQKANLKILISSSTNQSINEVLMLNATLGGKDSSRAHNQNSGKVIQITSSNRELGLTPVIDQLMPSNITVDETITIINSGNKSEQININIEGIPDLWDIKIMKNNKQLETFSISGDERIDLDLSITAPSYFIPIKIQYSMTMTVNGEENVEGTFKKQYLYDTSLVEYFVFTLSDKDLEFSEDLTSIHPNTDENPVWNDDYGRYWYIFQTQNVPQDSYSTIRISWDVEQDKYENLPIILLGIIIVILIIIPILVKTVLRGKKKLANHEIPISELGLESEVDKKTSDERIEKLKELDKKNVQFHVMIERIKKDEEDGLLTRTESRGMINSFKKEIEENNRLIQELSNSDKNTFSVNNIKVNEWKKSNLIDTETRCIRKRIKNLHNALSILDENLKSGILTAETHSKLQLKYKKEIIAAKKNLTGRNNGDYKKKKMFISLIERLDRDHNRGLLDEDTYNSLSNDYKNELNKLNELNVNSPELEEEN